MPATLDFIFKLIFGDERHADVLGSFLMAVLKLPESEFDSLTIIDPNLPQEFEDDKLGILDVKVKLKSGKAIDIEIQVKPLAHLRERAMFYSGKMITEQIRSGNDYTVIKPVVTIFITDFRLFPDDTAYHHKFELYDHENKVLFTNLMGIHILELPKLPETDDKTGLWEWMKFIKSEDEGELNMLAERSAALSKAVGIRMELSEDERLRMIAEYREKARRDLADLMWGARHTAHLETARSALVMGLGVDAIAKLTHLSVEETDELIRELDHPRPW